MTEFASEIRYGYGRLTGLIFQIIPKNSRWHTKFRPTNPSHCRELRKA
jgi:hypothetical protein